MEARILILAAIVALAGCAAPDAPVDGAPLNDSATVFVEDYDLGNATIAREDLANATLGPEHVHDAWGEADQLVLLEETAQAGTCEGEMDAALYALVTALNGQGAAYGCVRVSLPEGVVVPEGAGALTIDVDATQALKAGAMQFQFRNKAREEALEETTDPQHVWEIPLTEADWDIAHAVATSFVMYVASAGGPAGAFEGPVALRVVATRAPGWEPVVAIAHVDHWKLPALHDFPAPGVMRLADVDASVTNIDPARVTSGEEHGGIPFSDIVAPGARRLALVVDTIASDCPPAYTCWLVPILHVGGYARDRIGNVTIEEGSRRVYEWAVPDEVPEDSVYANESTTQIEARITACTPDGTCDVASIASTSITARVQAFAWQGPEVDLDLLKEIANAERKA